MTAIEDVTACLQCGVEKRADKELHCSACIAEFAAKAGRSRKERIATAALQGFAAHGWVDPDVMARRAVEAADSLIAALGRD